MDNGRSTLLGAFLWPQRRWRRQKQRAAARPDNQSGGCAGDPCAGPSGAWTISGGRVREMPRSSTCSQSVLSQAERQGEGLSLMPPPPA